MNTKENYKQLKNTYTKENFFIAYAVNGPIINHDYGIRAGLPVTNEISGPVKEPSPLNTRWEYKLPDLSIDGIL